MATCIYPRPLVLSSSLESPLAVLVGCSLAPRPTVMTCSLGSGSGSGSASPSLRRPLSCSWSALRLDFATQAQCIPSPLAAAASSATRTRVSSATQQTFRHPPCVLAPPRKCFVHCTFPHSQRHVASLQSLQHASVTCGAAHLLAAFLMPR